VKWLRQLWYAQHRATDIRVLWRACCLNAGSLEEARAAFLIHCSIDPAWQSISRDEMLKIVNALKAPE
jgi:hypothetical protein